MVHIGDFTDECSYKMCDNSYDVAMDLIHDGKTALTAYGRVEVNEYPDDETCLIKVVYPLSNGKETPAKIKAGQSHNASVAATYGRRHAKMSLMALVGVISHAHILWYDTNFLRIY